MQIKTEDIESMERLANVVKHVCNLPDLVMERHGILLPFKNNNDFVKTINIIRKHYRAVGDWLKYYLLNNSELIFELTNTDKVNYRPYAKKAIEFYHLAQHTYALCGYCQYLKRTPDWWLMVIEIEFCEKRFNDIGLTGTPTLKSKRQIQQIAGL